MADLIAVLAEMRDGETMLEANRKFKELMDSIYSTGKKGRITIDLEVRPNRMAMGGVVLEVQVDPSITVKKPELALGASLFFVQDDGGLSRNNPAQDRMFREEVKEVKEERKNG